MATQQTNLGKVHVFPSETLYNNNKTNVSANDLAFVVDNSSGIIAQSLGTNGYVKFANGLIIQWGRCSTHSTGAYGYEKVVFPISFSTVYTAYMTYHYTANTKVADCRGIYGLTTSEMYVAYDASTTHWVAVGKG